MVPEDADEREREQKDIIGEEFSVWKKNSPLLYDWVSNYALEWPSLTVQWLPEVMPSPKENINIHRLILGTHTMCDEANYLLIAEVELPVLDAEIDVRTKADGTEGFKMKSLCKVTTRMVHDGEVNRARYMPQNTVSRPQRFMYPVMSYEVGKLCTDR